MWHSFVFYWLTFKNAEKNTFYALKCNITFFKDNCLIRFYVRNVFFKSILRGWSKKMYGASVCKIAASTDKNWGNDSKNRLQIKYLIFSMYISRKLTFWNLTDIKKINDKNELLYNVTDNYQMSECQWNFATLLNFRRPSLAYEISNNFLTQAFVFIIIYYTLCIVLYSNWILKVIIFANLIFIKT
jgi:hypothetical protein